MIKKQRSISASDDFWKKLKVHCAIIGETMSEYIERIVKDDMEKSKRGE